MKLHLPKRLFTALLTAITLAAAPAAITLGSAAWGLSVSYEKSISTTGGTGTVTLDGGMTYDYTTGTLTLAGDPTLSTTIDFSMLYTWKESEDVVFLQNNAGSVSGLVAKTDGTIKGKAAGNNNYGTAKDKSLLLEVYEKSGNIDNTIRVTSTISQSNGVTLSACDTGEELYRDSSLKYNSNTWTSLVFDSRIVTNVYYSVAEGTEGANTVITSSDGKWKKSYATVVFNNANTKADATVLNEGSLTVDYNSDAFTNLSSDIIVGGSGQLELNTWGGDDNARNRDIDISDKKLYLESSTQNNGVLNLGVYCGDITLGDIQLIGDTRITKESSNAGSQVIFAGDVYGNYALTLAPERASDRFDGVVFTGDVDVKKINVATRAEIAFLGTTNIGEFVTNGDAAFTIGQDAEHTAKMTLSRLEMGNNAGVTGADSLTIHTGSLLKITGSNNTATNENHYKSVSLLIGEWEDETVLNIDGSLLAKEATLFTGNQGGSINIGTAGTIAIKGIATISGRNTSVLNLTLADGGKLILGSEGINDNNKNPDIRFGAGVVGMYADATTIGTAITLQSISGTTFDTAKYTFADDGDSISQLEGAAGGTMTISGAVGGTGKLIKTGAGTLKLSAENTYSGGTEITAGILELTDAGTLGTADAAVISSGAKLQFSGTTDKTITQNLTGGGEIAKQGSGRVTLAGTVGSADVAISKLTLSGGTLELQNSSYITSIQTSGGANLTFSGENVEHTVHGDLGTTGSMGTITIDAGTTLNVNGSLYSTWGISGIVVDGTLYAGELRLSSNSADNVSGSGVVDVDSFTAANGGRTYSISVDTFKVGKGGISLHPTWATTLDLSSAVTIVEGGISVKNGSQAGEGVLNFNDGSATVAGVVTNAGTINVNGGSVEMQKGLSGTGALHLVGGSLTLNGERNSIGSFAYTGGEFNYSTLTAGAVTISGESTLSNSGHLTVTGTLAGSIENTAAGKVTLSNGMSIAAETSASITGDGITEFGGTLINNGTLTLGGVISLSGDINQHYVVREAADETGLYVLDYTDTTATNTAGNGFKLTSDGSYWLIQGGTTNLLDDISSREGYTITQVTDANKAEGDSVGDVYISSAYNVGREFYISSGSVDVGTGVQAAATGYTLQGGSMIITDGSVSASAITCDSTAYTEGNTTGIITVGAGAELLLDTMPGDATLLNLLKGEGMVNAESAGRLVVTTEQNLGGAPVTTYEGKLEMTGARLRIGSSQNDTNKLSSLSEIILNDGGNIFYNGKGDGDTSVMDFQKITVESGTGEFHLEDSGAAAGAADTIQFGEIAVAAGATMQLTSRWQDSTYYVDKLTGAGEFHAKSATDSGNNKNLTVNNLAGFSGNLVFTNAGAGFAAVTVNTGSSEVNFHSLIVDNLNTLTLNVQADTTIGLLSAASSTVNVSANKMLTLGGGTAEAQKQHSIGTLTGDNTSSLTLSEHSTLALGATGEVNVKLSGSGELTKTGAGTLTFTRANSDFTGNIIVSSGVLKAGSGQSVAFFGADYKSNKNRTITVQDGATLDVNGTEVYYHVVLEEGAKIANTSTTAVGTGWKALPWVELEGDATFDAQKQMVMQKGDGDSGTFKLELNGHTLTKTGSAALYMKNVGITSGCIQIDAGVVQLDTGVTLERGVQISMAAATTLTLSVNASLERLNAAGGTVSVSSGRTLTLGSGTADAQKQHSIGTLSAANAGVTMGDYATLTLGGGTVENPVTHSIGTLTGGTGSMLNLAQHSVLNKVNTINGTVTLTGGGKYDLGEITSQWTKDNAASILGVILADDWTGVVKVSGNTSSSDKDVSGARLDDLANENSWVELNGVEGWLFNNQGSGSSYDHAANLILSGSGLTINDSSERTYIFSKSVKGTGNFTLATSSDSDQSYNFTGDISKWDGAFVVNADGEHTPITTLNLTGGGNLFSGAEGSGVVMNRGGVLNVNIGKTDADTTMRGSIGFGEVTTGTLNLTVQGNTEFQKSVEASQITVSSDKTATFNNTATANTVQLGNTATITGKQDGPATMSKVQMNSTGISGTAQDGSSSMSNADIEVLAQDATFTIADMTLTNTSITAASVNIVDSKVSGNVVLNVVKPTEAITAPNVGQGGTGGEISFTYGMALVDSSSSLTLNMEVPQAILPSESGLYTLTITLNGFAEGFDFNNIASQVVFGADSWLGQALQGATPVVTVDGNTISAGAAAAQSSGAPSVSYNATSGTGGNVGRLVITINGLNVPEPTTATLSLLALAALAGRRRRK